MGMPNLPNARTAEGYDASPGTPVNPDDAARETATIADQVDAAERYADTLAVQGYAGDGDLPDRGMFTMTGADDIPAS